MAWNRMWSRRNVHKWHYKHLYEKKERHSIYCNSYYVFCRQITVELQTSISRYNGSIEVIFKSKPCILPLISQKLWYLKVFKKSHLVHDNEVWLHVVCVADKKIFISAANTVYIQYVLQIQYRISTHTVRENVVQMYQAISYTVHCIVFTDWSHRQNLHVYLYTYSSYFVCSWPFIMIKV